MKQLILTKKGFELRIRPNPTLNAHGLNRNYLFSVYLPFSIFVSNSGVCLAIILKDTREGVQTN